METCTDCGKPIETGQGSYSRLDPAGVIGKMFHSTCGDPFGIKAKDAEIARLKLEIDTLEDVIKNLGDERDIYKARWEAAAGAATRRQAFIDQLPSR